MLLAFDAICRHRNITAAARELGLTQPAVSKSLKKLEEIYGHELIVRSSGHLEPTYAGLELLEKTRDLIGICEDIVRNDQASFEPTSETESFTVAAAMLDTEFFVKNLVLDAIDEYPLINVDLLNIPALEAYKYLDNKNIDFYIGYRSETLQKTIEIEKLIDVELTIICSSLSPLYKDGIITKDEFVNTKNINIYKQFHEIVLDEELKRKGLMQKEFKYVPDAETVYKVLRKTDMVYLETKKKAQKIIQKYDDIKILEPKFELPAIPLYLMWHRTHSTSAQHNWLRSYIKGKVDVTSYTNSA